jgi:hypothetical protein
MENGDWGWKIMGPGEDEMKGFDWKRNINTHHQPTPRCNELRHDSLVVSNKYHRHRQLLLGHVRADISLAASGDRTSLSTATDATSNMLELACVATFAPTMMPVL